MSDATPDPRRTKGIEMMKAVYGWDIDEVHGDFVEMTVDHLFGEVWSRPGLDLDQRRLLLMGILIGQGLDDVLGIQLDAALRLGERTPDELRDVVLFATHYAGWPRGAKLNSQVEELLARHAKAAARAVDAEDASDGES